MEAANSAQWFVPSAAMTLTTVVLVFFCVMVAKELRRRQKLLDEARRLDRMLDYERQAWSRGYLVAGVDEVGVGPMAGPVVAAAVILPQGTSIAGVDDSKFARWPRHWSETWPGRWTTLPPTPRKVTP